MKGTLAILKKLAMERKIEIGNKGVSEKTCGKHIAKKLKVLLNGDSLDTTLSIPRQISFTRNKDKFYQNLVKTKFRISRSI